MEDKETTRRAASKLSQYFPWWVNVLLAIGSYCMLKFAVPGLSLNNVSLQKLVQAAPTFAPIVTIPFLLLAAKQLYDTDIEEDKPHQPDSDDQNKPEK
jgi:hypothetical protein